MTALHPSTLLGLYDVERCSGDSLCDGCGVAPVECCFWPVEWRRVGRGPHVCLDCLPWAARWWFEHDLPLLGRCLHYRLEPFLVLPLHSLFDVATIAAGGPIRGNAGEGWADPLALVGETCRSAVLRWR